MRYPVLTHTKCTELAAQLVAGENPSVDPHVNWLGKGDELQLAKIASVAEDITAAARHWTDSDRDRFEGSAATSLYSALSDVPVDVLDDRGFWRFLSIRYFWEFIAWREEGPFSRGNHLKYVDSTTNTESVLPRMYLRARALGGGSALAGAIRDATDFWRSHIIRVRTGTVPALTRAFAEQQVQNRLLTEPLRETAKRLNRMWTNVVLHVYDEEEAAGVIARVWSDREDG